MNKHLNRKIKYDNMYSHASVFFMGGKMKKIKAFFRGVRKEAEKTKWLTVKETIAYSSVVVAMLIFFAVFFYGLDVLFAFLKGLIN